MVFFTVFARFCALRSFMVENLLLVALASPHADLLVNVHWEFLLEFTSRAGLLTLPGDCSTRDDPVYDLGMTIGAAMTRIDSYR